MYNEEYIHLKHNEEIKAGLSSKRFDISASCVSWCSHQGRLKFLDDFKPSVIKSRSKCTEQQTSSIIFGCLFPNFSKGSS